MSTAILALLCLNLYCNNTADDDDDIGEYMHVGLKVLIGWNA